MILIVAALAAYEWTLRSARDAAVGAGAQAVRIAEGFRSGTITTTFLAALPEIRSTGSGNLELATSRVTETLSRRDDLRILWNRVSLGETVAEIRVPVTYRYHVRLDDPWRLEVSDRTCVVQAPPIRPSLPPAIHTDGIERHTREGWLRFDGDRQLADLERALTPTLENWAADERHLSAVREQCRKTVANFIRGWLLREDHWREDRFHAVVVLFPDENGTDPAVIAPSVTLENAPR